MATKKPLRQKTIENPSVDYIRPGKEKALARLHKVLKTLDANGNDDAVFNASKIKASPRPGKSATPESSPKDSYGSGYVNNYDSLYAALGKNRQDNPNKDYATDEETEINETGWATFAGGTGAHNPNHHSYSKKTEHGEYHIDPPQRKGGGYRLNFAHTHQTPHSQSKVPHTGLWHDLGRHSSPNSAKGAAEKHHASLKEGTEVNDTEVNEISKDKVIRYLNKTEGQGGLVGFHQKGDTKRAPSRNLGLRKIARNPERISNPARVRATSWTTSAKKVTKEETELDEASVTRKHFKQVADIVKHIEDPKKRKELAHHHASIFKLQNPRFDHKKFLAAANVHEDIEVNELSDKTMSRYIAKVPHDKGKHGEGIKRAVYKLTQGQHRPKKLVKPNAVNELAYDRRSVSKEIRKDSRIGKKEGKLIHRLLRGRTTDKKQDHTMGSIIRKEETNINELSKGTLSNYTKKAKDDVTKHLERDPRAFNNRLKGVATASKKLSLQREETEINELSRKTLHSYIRKATSATAHDKVKNAHHKDKRQGGILKATAKTWTAKEETEVNEGRKATPLHGHENHYKSDDELRYIAKDAHAAAENFKNSGMRVPGSHIEVENKYRDQMHDALTVLHHRSKGGKRLERPKTNEEILHELSKKVLSSYADKAHSDVIYRRFSGGSKDKANQRKNYIEKADKKVTEEDTLDEKEHGATHQLRTARKTLRSGATGMNTKEAAEIIKRTREKKLKEEDLRKSLEEVSKDLLTRYAAKASASHTDAVLSKDKKTMAKRTIGLGKAKALVRSDEEIEEAATTHKGPKRRSPAAAALRLPMYRKKVIPSGKVYNRKHKSVNEASRIPKGITSPGEIRKYLAQVAKQNKEKVAMVARALKKAEHTKHKVKPKHYDYHEEEVKTLIELSKERLTDYAAKASASHTDAILSGDKKKMAKRTIGMGKAKALVRGE